MSLHLICVESTFPGWMWINLWMSIIQTHILSNLLYVLVSLSTRTQKTTWNTNYNTLIIKIPRWATHKVSYLALTPSGVSTNKRLFSPPPSAWPRNFWVVYIIKDSGEIYSLIGPSPCHSLVFWRRPCPAQVITSHGAATPPVLWDVRSIFIVNLTCVFSYGSGKNGKNNCLLVFTWQLS